jgi:hypothetical protein
VLKYDWTKETPGVTKLEDESVKDICLSLILFKLYSDYLTQDALEGFGAFKIQEQVILTLKYVYADDLVLLPKEETVLKGKLDRLVEVGKRYGLETEIEKPKVMRISRHHPQYRLR